MLIVGGIIIFLVRRGDLQLSKDVPRIDHLIINIMIASVFLAPFCLHWRAVFPRPVNSFINAMNRLASGDYKARLHFGKYIDRHPTALELMESFNHMAEELEKTEMSFRFH